ncbi:MAG: T9SS type A sorting domain-containing protein [Ignavibacteriales bacterium]|nr:T9SS type A sorting domain-containing protein [Ignavibacteriales bacterium]
MVFKFLSLFLIMIPAMNLFSQQDTLVDVFPLAVGNQWTYHYSSSYDDYLGEYYSSQRGTAIYTIISKTNENDSTRWKIKEYRDVLVCGGLYYPSHGDTCFPSVDSTIFDLIELHDYRHQLYRIGYEYWIWNSVFPFTKEFSDTTKVFRYMPVDSGDTIKYQTRRSQTTCYNYLLTFKKDLGLLAIDCSFLCAGANATTEHRLTSAVINSIEEENNSLKGFSLAENYPNPFNSATMIQYHIPQRSFIILDLFDLLGRRVRTIYEGTQEAGSHQVSLSMVNLPSGIYYYRLVANNFVSSKKLVYLK